MISKHTLTNLYNARPTWEEIPEFLTTLRARAAAFADLMAEDLPHALITEYSPATTIGWHRDKGVFGIHKSSEDINYEYKYIEG